jgi:hypothetical protein
MQKRMYLNVLLARRHSLYEIADGGPEEKSADEDSPVKEAAGTLKLRLFAAMDV